MFETSIGSRSRAPRWIAQTATAFHRVFGPRVAALNLEPDHES
jgi:hypothetical protein